MRTFTIAVVLLACALISAAALYAARYTAQIEAQFPASGSIVLVDDTNMHVMPSGSAGTPVFLIHGAGGNARELDTLLAPKLNGQHRLFSIDRPGHGYSQRMPDSDKLQTQAQAIARLIETLTPNEKAIVVGHSYGAAVSLRLALDRPEILQGIVLIAPASHDWGEGKIAWYNRYASIPVLGLVMSQLVTVFGPPQARAGLAHSFSPAAVPNDYYEQVALGLLFRPSSFRANAQDMSALRNELLSQQERYGELTVPTLIFSGSADITLDPKRHAERLKAEVPSIELVNFAEEGHVPHVRRGDDIAEAILRFAKRTR